MKVQIAKRNRKIIGQQNSEPVISIENVGKTFTIRETKKESIMDSVLQFYKRSNTRKVIALESVTFHVNKGEVFGIIGRNGCGKSTLLKMIVGAFPPNKGGKIEVKGKLIRLALGMGFDPNISARDNIYLNGSILGLTFKQIGQKFNEIIEFAELENFVETKVKFYSSGMVSRLAFAIAVHAEADIFLMDEFFGGVGDVSFRAKSDKVFQEAFLNRRTIILVSHDLATIDKYCDQVMILEKGIVHGIGTPSEMIPIYKKLFVQ